MSHSYYHSPQRKISNNKILAQKTLIQILSLAGGLFLLILKIAGWIFWLLKQLARIIVVILVKILGLPLYKLFKKINLKLVKYKSYLQQQFGSNFSRNIIIYGGLILLAIFTSATNIKAREIRPEEIGRDSSIYILLADDLDYEIVESANDSLDISPSVGDKALDEVGVTNQLIRPAGNPEEEEITPLLSQAGDALVKPELTGTEPNLVLRDKIITYVVQEGDTISEIAERFGISTNTILWENKIGPRDFVKPGQELVILPVTGVSHTIKKGESLSSIAKTYRAKDEDVLEVNKLASAGALPVGTKLVIPDGIPPAPAEIYRPPSSSLGNLRDIFKPAQPIAGKFNWPTNSRRITQYFRGWRHTGIDIANKSGQPIYAAEDGIVVTAGWNAGGYGWYVIIDHGQGIHTLYGHSSKLYVTKGERVKKGQVIAAIGSTGRSTGPHVHFEVRVGGNRLNPLDYL